VTAHALNLFFRRVGVAFFILKEPVRGLVVPYQRVANDEYIVLFAEFDKRIGCPEIPKR
jgi:hypothetical protein